MIFQGRAYRFQFRLRPPAGRPRLKTISFPATSWSNGGVTRRRDAHSGARRDTPSPAPLGKVARSAGWGVAHRRAAGRIAEPAMPTCTSPSPLSAPHPALRATFPSRAGEGYAAVRDANLREAAVVAFKRSWGN